MMRRFSSHSRFWATQMKRDIDDTFAFAVATNMLRASALPRSCASLMQPQQLPVLPTEWQISWTDTPMRHRKTGLARYYLLVLVDC